MSELKIFDNPEFGQIRTVIIDDVVWFVGGDVADKLGYQNGSRDINRHVDIEDKLAKPIALSGQRRRTILINESGLYSLILSSKLPTAQKFKHWVTSEILPAIRKTGGYGIHQNPNTTDYVKLASLIAKCKDDRLPYVLNMLKVAGIIK